MMLLLDFAVARFDCTGGNKKKHGNRFNNNIDREYLSVNNKLVFTICNGLMGEKHFNVHVWLG